MPAQPIQEERKREMLNAKHNKLNINGEQIPHPNNIKENWITGTEYYQVLFQILLINMHNWIKHRQLQTTAETDCFLAMQCQLSLTQSL